jgi:hypothetical protein
MSAKKWNMVSNAPYPEDVDTFENSKLNLIDKILLDENKQYPEIKDIKLIPF